MDQPEEIDHEPAIGMFNFAESFLDAGRRLARAVTNEELRLRSDSPIYYVYSHALELTLKAFLRAKGYTARRLSSRNFGHQLGVLWKECIKQGLSTAPNNDVFIEQMIEILDPLATAYEFRYLKIGTKKMPQLDELELAIGRLRAAVGPVVRSASSA